FLEDESDLLLEAEREERLQTEIVRAEAREALNDARRMMGTDPEAAVLNLKTLADSISRVPNVNPDVRERLLRQTESALRQASYEQIRFEERQQARRAQQVAAEERLRLLDLAATREQQVEQLMARFNALVAEERYVEAVEASDRVAEIAPGSTIATAAAYKSELLSYTAENAVYRDLKFRKVMEALYDVDYASIPFPDQNPILYPPLEVWRELTESREQYKSIDLATPNAAEQQIYRELDQPTSLQ